MIVVDPGHECLLSSLDGEQENRLVFVKREGPGYPGNIGHHPGTTMQEVLRVLIDRANYVNNQIRSYLTEEAIGHMEKAILALEIRAARRHGRPDVYLRQAVDGPTCKKCGHAGCQGECHPDKP